ncbi:MAG: RloB family protein [Pyrinomonadaceae bacterium]
MPGGRSFRRPPPSRSVGRKLIIVCEGKKTERGYFEEIRKSRRLPTLRVYVVHPDATDPLSIVRAAIEYRQARKDERAWAKEDTAWAVFDGDEHREANPDRWNDAIQIARSKDIHLAVSNPCFELWYLLHYRSHTADITRQKAFHLLKSHISDYEKAKTLWPSPLESLTDEAIQRARQLASRAETDELQLFTNPYTSVYELVESLLALDKEVRHR